MPFAVTRRRFEGRQQRPHRALLSRTEEAVETWVSRLPPDLPSGAQHAGERGMPTAHINIVEYGEPHRVAHFGERGPRAHALLAVKDDHGPSRLMSAHVPHELRDEDGPVSCELAHSGRQLREPLARTAERQVLDGRDGKAMQRVHVGREPSEATLLHDVVHAGDSRRGDGRMDLHGTHVREEAGWPVGPLTEARTIWLLTLRVSRALSSDPPASSTYLAKHASSTHGVAARTHVTLHVVAVAVMLHVASLGVGSPMRPEHLRVDERLQLTWVHVLQERLVRRSMESHHGSKFCGRLWGATPALAR